GRLLGRRRGGCGGRDGGSRRGRRCGLRLLHGGGTGVTRHGQHLGVDRLVRPGGRRVGGRGETPVVVLLDRLQLGSCAARGAQLREEVVGARRGQVAVAEVRSA